MKRFVAAVAGIGLLALSSAGFAADTEKMYLSKSNGKTMVMGGTNAEGTELIMGEAGKKPAKCPAGSFYTTDASRQMVMACDNDAKYALSKPESGAMMANGKPYPEGSMMMTPSK